MTIAESIYNFRQFDDKLATGGQPDASELQAIAAAGYQVVINLGLDDAPYATPHERTILESLGLRYEHIPVDFEAPEVERFFAFRDLYRSLAERKCFIHCAANKRVSAFMALYRMIELGWSRKGAEADMLEIWEPNAAWLKFMQQVLQRASQYPLEKH